MIDGMTGMMSLGILFITVLLCRYSDYLGRKSKIEDTELEKALELAITNTVDNSLDETEAG